MIDINNLNKFFSDNNYKVDIFANLNLKINSWEFIAILWPSWSWKSTFLNILSWIDRDFDWDVKIDSISLKKFSDDQITSFRWKNISYIFQNFKLIDNLTVRENIDLIIELNSLDRNFLTDEIIKLVWLEHKKDSYVFNLSWWESQRVAIARAFVWKTKLLLADEPTGALDSKNKQIISNLILELHKKTKNTILMITHDNEIASIADSVYQLKNNNLIKV